MNAKTIVTAAALAAAFVTGAVQAAPAAQKTGEVYGYSYRVQDQRSAFTDGARQGKFDAFTEGARIGNRDAFTDGARVTNRDGLVASIGNRDAYTDGARVGKADPFTEVVAKDNRKLYRARFAGLERDQAEAVCRTLKRAEISCITVRN